MLQIDQKKIKFLIPPKNESMFDSITRGGMQRTIFFKPKYPCLVSLLKYPLLPRDIPFLAFLLISMNP